MKSLKERAATWLGEVAHHSAQVADEVMLGNLRRLRWVVWILIPFMLLRVVVYWFVRTDGTPDVLLWKNYTGWAYLCAALWLAVVGLLSNWLGRKATVGPLARGMQILAPLGCVVWPALFVAIDQRVTSNISAFLVGAMFTSVLFLMRPASALLVFALGFAFFAVGMGLTQTDPVQLLNNRANGLGASLMGLVLAWVLWHKNTSFILLQRELRSRNTALVQQQEELVRLATRDSLTGLYNRGEMLRLAEAELKRAQRHATDTSAIMVDLDHFKNINDTYGHLAGDTVLKHAATQLAQGVRGTDYVARMGGEEFMVLLPQTSLDAARMLAEKLLRLLRDSTVPITGELKVSVTASFGVGMLPAGQSGTVTWLYAAADHAMYEAKREGRNRVNKTEPDGSLTASDFQRMRKQ